jgi:hypothetical protein
MPHFLDSILKEAGIGQSRSSVLNPLQWLLVLLIAGLGIVLWSHAPPWLQVFFAVLIGWTVILITVAYCYFMVREPSILRSQDYSLAKHAMDKGLFTEGIARQILHREAELASGGGIGVNNIEELKKLQGEIPKSSQGD